MSSELAVRPQTAALAIGSLNLNGLDDLARVAKSVAESGYFRDANTPQKVAVKMFFAMTMGFSPIAGLTGVDLIEGSPTPNAHFWAAAIDDSPLYDYEIVEETDDKCVIAFSRWDDRTQAWRKRGTVTWTMEDAKRAKLAGKDNWVKYPRAMLYARAMTEGGRKFCPGLFGGVRAYAPEELGSEAPPAPAAVAMGEPTTVVDATTGEVIEIHDPPQEESLFDPPDPRCETCAGPGRGWRSGPLFWTALHHAAGNSRAQLTGPVSWSKVLNHDDRCSTCVLREATSDRPP